jgi:hypothetical protein
VRVQDLGKVDIKLSIAPRVYAFSRPRPVPQHSVLHNAEPIFNFHVRLLSGTGLPKFKGSSLPDPVVHLSVPGAGRPRKTQIINSTCNPVMSLVAG